MSMERPSDDSTPVHLHVDDTTPVHVHLKKPKKPGSVVKIENKSGEVKQCRTAAGYGASNLRRSTATSASRSRSKSPARGSQHWVPPPAKSSGPGKYSWQGASHRLEVASSDDARVIQDTLRTSDLDTDEEDKVHGKMRKYEKTINSLMNEVGSLKSEVELQRSHQELDRKSGELESSRRVLENQEDELAEYKRELQATEVENRLLRRSMDWLKEDAALTRTEREHLDGERDVLMKTLVEVELDGQAAAKQVAALRDMIRRLREEKRLSVTDSAMLAKHKELLNERLGDFESTNRTLRQLLRERHEDEANSMRLAEQRDVLLAKLAETEDRVQMLRTENLEKERRLQDAIVHADAQKEENVTMSSLHGSLENTRAHLQKQLRQKEADCNRMAVQIRSIESQLAQERIDVDHLQQLLNTAKEKADRDKDALKKATRVQKQRATKSEDALGQLNAQVLEREQHVADMGSEMEALRSRLDKLNKEKSQSNAENTGLKTRVSELESVLEHLEEDSKARIESTSVQLHEKASEASTFRLENDRLKTSLGSAEDRIIDTEGEMATLRANLRQYEALVEEYRGQMNKSRREADDSIMQLEEQKRETSRVAIEGESEIEKVKVRLQSRLKELEPIPELLQTTELKLQDATEKLLMHEKRNADHTRLIAELTTKVEQQNEQVDVYRTKAGRASDSARSMEAKMDNVERKLRDLEDTNRELLSTVAKREESMHHATLRLDEKGHENMSLQRQLESALQEARRQTDQAKEKSACKDRSSQQRILDLEAQLSTARADNARNKREKEEAERKFNSRLYDLKDRLEQSHSTNRSMQNYVQFLKSSYANVFGDASFSASSPIRGGGGAGGGATFH